MKTYTTLDQRTLVVSDTAPTDDYIESGTLWLNTLSNRLMRYSVSGWVESHDHGDYYALKTHVHQIDDIENLQSKLNNLQDNINALDGSSALYIGYFGSYQEMIDHQTDFKDNCWCTVAVDETKNNIKSKYIYSNNTFTWAGEVADDNLLIDDNSNTTNLCWSSRKLTTEFAKRPLIIIQDTEPTDLEIGQIWISKNPS